MPELDPRDSSALYEGRVDVGTYKGQWVAQQYESRRVVRQIVANIFEGLVYYFVLILLDLVGLLINRVYCLSRPELAIGSDWDVFEISDEWTVERAGGCRQRHTYKSRLADHWISKYLDGTCEGVLWSPVRRCRVLLRNSAHCQMGCGWRGVHFGAYHDGGSQWFLVGKVWKGVPKM
jgi:hypothetical protein